MPRVPVSLATLGPRNDELVEVASAPLTDGVLARAV
jgi:hypothetical protein